MTQLCNLRCLRLTGTKVNRVPKGIGKLKFLTFVEDYLIGDGVRAVKRLALLGATCSCYIVGEPNPRWLTHAV